MRLDSRGKPKGESVLMSSVKEQIRISTNSTLLSIIPNQIALEKGLPPVSEWKFDLNQLNNENSLEPTEPQTELQEINQYVDLVHNNENERPSNHQESTMSELNLDTLPALQPDKIWNTSTEVERENPIKMKGFDGNSLFQNMLDRFGKTLITEIQQPTVFVPKISQDEMTMLSNFLDEVC